MAELPEKRGNKMKTYGLISLFAVLVLGTGGALYVMQEQPVMKQATSTSTNRSQETPKDSETSKKKTETKKKLPMAVWEEKVAEQDKVQKETMVKEEQEAGGTSLAALLTVLSGKEVSAEGITESEPLKSLAPQPLLQQLAQAVEKQMQKEAERVKEQVLVHESKAEDLGQTELVLLDKPVTPTEAEILVLEPLVVTPPVSESTDSPMVVAPMIPDEPITPELPLAPVVPTEPIIPAEPEPVGPSFTELTAAAKGKLQLVQGEAQTLTNQLKALAQRVNQLVQFPTQFSNQATDVKQTWSQVAPLIAAYNELSHQLKDYVAEHPEEFPVDTLLYQTVYQQLQEKVREIQTMQVEAETMTQALKQMVKQTQYTQENLVTLSAAYETTQVPQAEAIQEKVKVMLQQVNEAPAVAEAVQPVIQEVKADSEALTNAQSEVTQAFSQADQTPIQENLQDAETQVAEIEAVATEQKEAVIDVVADFNVFTVPGSVKTTDDASAPENDGTLVKEALDPATTEASPNELAIQADTNESNPM